MSWQDSKWAITQAAGSASAKAILLVIAEASKAGRCILAQETIAGRAEVDRRTVIRQMKALEVRGLIRRTKRSDGHGHRTSDLIILATAETPDDKVPLRPSANLSLGEPSPRDNGDAAQATSSARPGDTVAQEPVLNRDSEPEDSQRAIVPARREHDTEAFRAWWPHYPSQVRRHLAEKAFAKVLASGQATLDELIDGAIAYAKTDKVERGYVQNPTTWLNGGGWSDEPASQPRGAGFSGLDYALRSLG
jgi:DNA-binding transcriptional MocR family regulator